MKRPVDWVHPFLGNGATDLPAREGIAAAWFWPKAQVGNTHPGACSPLGMVSACAYSSAYVTGYGMYRPNSDGQPDRWFDDDTASGFTHFQHSGTGAVETYYNYVRVTPLVGGLAQVGTRWALEEETASPGYYATGLKGTGIRAELTVSPKAAFHRYTFPASGGSQIAVDLSTGGIKSDNRDRGTRPSEAEFEVISNRAACGRVVMAGIPICFYMEIDTEAERCGVWSDGREVEDARSFSEPAIDPETLRSFGVFFGFPTHQNQAVQVRIGFSLRSVEKARENMRDIADRTFDEVAARTRKMWADDLDRIRVTGATDAQRQIFYSALYHSLIKPTDCTDESPFWAEDGPFFFDLATMWDMYKTQLPLLMTVYPDRGRDIVNAFLSMAEHQGVLPIGYVMNQDNSRFENQASALHHMTIADAYSRGIDGIDWQRAKDVMVRMLFLNERGQNFLKNGFTHPFTHTLDLACACFCTAQIAKGLGDVRLYEEMMALAGNWRNVYDPDTGMLGESRYYEGVAWNYSFRLFHDEDGRIALCGGDEAFVEAMDRFFGYDAPPFEQLRYRPYGDRMAEGFSLNRFEGLNNESDMETPYTYIYAGRPDRTAEVVRAALKYQYTTGRGGLPGNDDSGGLSSWYVWSAMGLFPVAGQDVYLIGSPIFDSSEIAVGNHVFTVKAVDGSDANIYVQRATLNGREIDRAYLRHGEIKDGGELVLTMGPQPSAWGRRERPPSYRT